MTQRIIRIGTSAGITIPKKELEEHGLKVGDEVKFTIEPVKKVKHSKFAAELDKFMDIYDQDLKNLAKRWPAT